MTEAEFQSGVVELAQRLRWLVYHTRDSRGSAAGFPDLVLVRDGRLIFAELKTDRGRVSHAQQAWLDDLDGVAAVEVFVWRPGDWPFIQRALR